MCWFWAVCGFWPPSWLENPHAYPGSSFDSVQTLSKGLGNVDRRGVCTLSDVRLLLGVGASTAQNDSRIDSCEIGFGAEGVSQLSDVMLCGVGGVGYEAAKPRVTGCSLSWRLAPALGRRKARG